MKEESSTAVLVLVELNSYVRAHCHFKKINMCTAELGLRLLAYMQLEHGCVLESFLLPTRSFLFFEVKDFVDLIYVDSNLVWRKCGTRCVKWMVHRETNDHCRSFH